MDRAAQEGDAAARALIEDRLPPDRARLYQGGSMLTQADCCWRRLRWSRAIAVGLARTYCLSLIRQVIHWPRILRQEVSRH